MAQPKSNLTLCTAPSEETGKAEMYLSEPEQMNKGDGDWGFAAYQSKDVWMATFVFPSQHSASRAREAMIPALRECTFIATAESPPTTDSDPAFPMPTPESIRDAQLNE